LSESAIESKESAAKQRTTMCRILKCRFTCGHGSAHLLSKCGGTKHNHNKEESSPACKSVAHLDIKLPDNCGPCQQEAFVAQLKTNISEADDKFMEELWISRLRFPLYKGSTFERVGLGRFEKKCSPLRREVQPDEIPDPPAVVVPTVWN
jgi:hypothetical protein